MRGKTSSFVSLAIMLAVGVFFLLHPGDTLITAARIVGIALVVIGAIGVLNQLLRKEDKIIPAIVVYAVEVVAGIVILSSPAFVISLYPIIIGIVIALYGLSDVLSAIQMKRLGMSVWKQSIVMAIISVVLGIVILCNPFGTVSTLVRIIGVVLIYKAVTGLYIRIKL